MKQIQIKGYNHRYKLNIHHFGAVDLYKFEPSIQKYIFINKYKDKETMWNKNEWHVQDMKRAKSKLNMMHMSFGLWKDNNINGLKYQQKLRNEWI